MDAGLAEFVAGRPAWAKLLAIMAGSYVSEDLALGTSAWFFARGEMSFPLLFAGNVLGIATGDMAIFGMGRWLGARAEALPLIGRAFAPERRSRGREFWTRWGGGVLVVSRFLPGTRVITAFTAGLYGVAPVLAGALFVALASVWVTAGAYGLKGLSLVLSPGQLVAAFVAVVLCARAASSWLDSGLTARDWARARGYGLLGLRHFEFWPMWAFYPPVVPHYLALALEHRSLLLPSLANPSIASGGIIGESKDEILSRLPHASPFRLRSVKLPASADATDRAEAFMRAEGLAFPVILKPDVGQRGSGVRLVRAPEELSAYLTAARFPTLLQEYCAYPNEAGVFYRRAPWESAGRVTSVTRKVFPVVTGDGRRTLAQLILADERARLISGVYFERFHDRLAEVLPAGRTLRLVESGNHCQGCVFENGRELIAPGLTAAVDSLLQRTMPDFHVGRLDVRYESDERLRRGEAFKVVEINGVASEATHIYDARETLAGAYRSLRGQMDDLFAIGAYNRRALGRRPMTLRELARELSAYKRVQKGHPATT